MLKELIGEETEHFGRIMLLLYAAMMGMAVIMGAGIRVLHQGVYTGLAGAIGVMVFSTQILAALIMPAVLCVLHLTGRLSADGGRGTIPFPVRAHQLLLSNLVSTLFWSFMSLVSLVCALTIVGMTAVPLQSSLRFFRRMSIYIRMAMLGKRKGFLLVWIVILILVYITFLMHIYAALAIGHLRTSHSIFLSFLAFSGIGILRLADSSRLAAAGYDTGLRSFPSVWMKSGGIQSMQDPGVIIIYHVLLIIMLGLAALFSLGRRLKKYPVCLLPGTSAVKKNGEECSNTPADRPCAPDSGGTELCSGQYDRQHYAEDQVGKGTDHKGPHETCASEDSVRDKLGGDHEVEGREDPEQHQPRVHGIL